MGSCGVECLQGAHYGRKEPRGQVPAARAAADRLRPAEPSKPLQLLHRLNHITAHSGVPHPACLQGGPWAALEGSWDTLPAAAQRALHPNSPEPRTPRLAEGGLAAHAHSGYTPRLRAHRHTRSHAWLRAARPQVRDRRAAGQRASSGLPPAPDRARGSTAPHPAGNVAAPGAPVGWKRGGSMGLGMGPCPSVWGSPAPGPPRLTLRAPGRIPPAAALTPPSSLCRLAPSTGAPLALSARCPAAGGSPACSSVPRRDRARHLPLGPGARTARGPDDASGRRHRSGSPRRPRSRDPRGGLRGGAVTVEGTGTPGTGRSPCPPPPGQPRGSVAAPLPRPPAPA